MAPITTATADTAADPHTIDVTTVTPGIKKQPQRSSRTGANPANIVVSKVKKRPLLNEVGGTLVDQLYANPSLDDHLAFSRISVNNRLCSNITATPTASLSASSKDGSSRTLTEFDATPLTAWDSRDYHNGRPASFASTEADIACSCSKFPRIRLKYQEHEKVFNLDDFCEIPEIEHLTRRYGQVAHMGILDRSYRLFVNETRTAALSFKVQNGVAVMCGNPLCETDAIPGLLAEFARYRRRYGLGIAFMGVSESFARNYAQTHGWLTIRFGIERVLNPQTNDVLLEHGGKRIAAQNRQLLHRSKGGILLGVYAPAAHGVNPQLQTDLVAIYDAWRTARNLSGNRQAFISVYDLFALPALMTFVYTRGPDGCLNGFAALRRLDTGGYHIDPCIAAPGSPKGISDLLVVAAMALLHHTGVSYLGVGFEPLHTLSLEDISGVPRPLARLTRDLYRHVFHHLPIRGKKAYHDKFRPDPSQDSGVYLAFPKNITGPCHLLAMTHMANISLCNVFWADVRAWVSKRLKHRTKSLPEVP